MALQRKFKHAPIVALLTILALASQRRVLPVPPSRPDRQPPLHVS